jgi:transposase InsO family protein
MANEKIEFSGETLFRYQLVSEVLARVIAGQPQAEAIKSVASRTHHFIFSKGPRLVSTRSLYRWLAAYRLKGISGLDSGAAPVPPFSSKALSSSLIDFFLKQKEADVRASVPELIRRAREYGHLGPHAAIDRTTVYRTLKKLGAAVEHRRQRKDRDSRRFAYAHRMEMVLCDGKHFRAGATRARRLAMFFLDDATRRVLHVVVGTSENAALFQRGLYELIVKVGFMSVLYMDHGPGFIAEDTVSVVKRLEILLIHGEKAYPQGHGKLERFHQTATGDLLRGLDGRPDVDPGLQALELRLGHYLETQYNHRPHESLKGCSPQERFEADEKALRFPESREALRGKFEVYLLRRVSADHVVKVDALHYEMPRGYDEKKVLLHKKLLDGGGVFFLHQGQLIELHPVDLEANARSRRANHGGAEETEVETILPKSAADLAYERDFGPVVDPDGGFNSNPNSKEVL